MHAYNHYFTNTAALSARYQWPFVLSNSLFDDNSSSYTKSIWFQSGNKKGRQAVWQHSKKKQNLLFDQQP